MLFRILLSEFYQHFVPDNWPKGAQEIVLIILQILTFTLLLYLAKYAIQCMFSIQLLRKLPPLHRGYSRRLRTIRKIIQNLLTYILYFIYAYNILSVLGVAIGTLLAGAGIAGIAIGLGAQDLINDMINGFFIILENQFEVGDFISIPEHGITGKVIDVGIRTTTVRPATGEIFYVPNSLIQIVNNNSRSPRQITIDMPITDDASIELIESTIARTTDFIYQNYEAIIYEPPQIVGFVRGNDQTFNYRISFLVEQGQEYIHTSKFYREYLHSFQAAGIRVPHSIYDES